MRSMSIIGGSWPSINVSVVGGSWRHISMSLEGGSWLYLHCLPSSVPWVDVNNEVNCPWNYVCWPYQISYHKISLCVGNSFERPKSWNSFSDGLLKELQGSDLDLPGTSMGLSCSSVPGGFSWVAGILCQLRFEAAVLATPSWFFSAQFSCMFLITPFVQSSCNRILWAPVFHLCSAKSRC